AETFATFLSDWAIAFGPNRFLAPVSGLSFLKSGLMLAGIGLMPTCATLTRTPAIMQTAAIGAAASATWRATFENSVPMPWISTSSGWRVSWRTVIVA